MSDVVQQIKDRLNILDVIGAYVELHKAGRQFKAKCPFHNEKTPSFNVSPERGMYHCYGCGVGGDMFTFIEAIEGVDFKGALKILAEKARVELVPVSPEKQSERDRLYAVLEAATHFYTTQLGSAPKAHSYLIARGVSEASIASWRLGFAPGPPEGGWREVKEYLQSQKFTLAEMRKAGLIKEGKDGKEPYDVFRTRVMFPLFDQSGRVVAFSGRTLETGPDIPKYVNSPETELFKKSEILYGYDRAKHGIRTLDFSLIVEGQFDVVMSHQAGYHNTVAVSGTALTVQHVQLLERMSKKVVLALDADKAGIAAARRSADIMLRRGLDVKVALMPLGKDPADIILGDPKEFKKIIGQSLHVIEFLLRILSSQNLDSRTFKLRAREEVIPYVPLLPNKIDQDHFEAIIAEALGTTKDAVHYEVERAAELQSQKAEGVEHRASVGSPVKEATTTVESADTRTRYESVLTFLVGSLPLFTPAEQQKITTILESITKQSLSQLEAATVVGKRAEVIFKAEAYLGEFPRRLFEADVVHRLNELRQLMITKALKESKQALKQAEQDHDEEQQLRLLSEVNQLKQALQGEEYKAETIFG